MFPEDHVKPKKTVHEPSSEEIAAAEKKKAIEMSERALAQATEYVDGLEYEKAMTADLDQMSHMYEVGYDGDGNKLANSKQLVKEHETELQKANDVWMVQLGERVDSGAQKPRKHKKQKSSKKHAA